MYTSIWEYYKYAVFKYNENRKKSQIYRMKSVYMLPWKSIQTYKVRQ